ncbi:MAG: wax ester/triacylglycerol synthase family O-acyltransferase [Mycobacterium sp.]|uniref:wax ester/triacylglycerol synthase family O-acyltransferase n=1 Tax=Mycobacterium sp. TaxID=1785 RepID=UPI0026149D8D|nr:wax ester/triacylglycerol synthase family O-acyltransferase [Mycobacterium sp.]MDI3313946.1 wax ester/triacylglycerol synthase family O-acyltransferase [Mycobacterium sp.]
MAEPVDSAGLPTELGALDYLLHRGEARPRTRSGIMGLELLDTTPDWRRFRTKFEHASRRALRLRQKVVVPTLPTTRPRWVVDPDFDVDFHVRHLRVPEPGTLRDVFDLAEVMLQSPLDISRPLWSATLVEGLADGKAAMLLHLSHAVADGVGSVEMFAHIYDAKREPEPEPTPPQPIPVDLTSNDLMLEGLAHLPAALADGVREALSGTASLAGRAVLNPASLVTGVVGYLRSSARVLRPAAEPSPLLRRRSLSTGSEALDMSLPDLHAAAKAAGGSINDAYLAGLCGALRRYHVALGVPVSTLPMAVPVNLRAEADPAGGNRFAGINLAAPVGTVDPVARIKKIRAQMTRRREERALNVLGSVAPLLSILPTPVLEAITGAIIASDVQASNVPGYPGETYIAGAKVLRQYGFGPLPGVAMMAVLVSRGGFCTVTVRYDRAAVRDEALFARCLLEGFDEVLALAGEPAPHAVPASFAVETPDSLSRSLSSGS